MAENSKIQWTDHTFNPWRGCTKVSDGCKNCYADKMSGRNPAVLGVWGKNGTRVVASESMWKQPLKWNREASADGVRKRVFCASLADVFEGPESMPESAFSEIMLTRQRLFQLVELTPNLDWLLLTKRPGNILLYVPMTWLTGFPPNVWIGTTVENQDEANKRIPELLKIPAAVRFLSCEPLLGPVDLEHVATDHWAYGQVDVLSGYLQGDHPDDYYDFDSDPSGWTRNPPDKWERGPHAVHWVIVGGESGRGARPMHPDWARSIRDQCVAAGVGFHFKQWGEYEALGPLTNEGGQTLSSLKGLLTSRWLSNEALNMAWLRVGKHAAGRLLDGREWNELPEVAHV